MASSDRSPFGVATGDGGNGGNGGGPVLRRRRTLPGSRALVGGLLMALAAVGLFAAYTQTQERPQHPYVVAAHSLAAGKRLDASDLSIQRMELPDPVRARAFDRRSALVGATLLTPLEAGELVQASAVVASSPGSSSREITFALERGRIASGVKEGERVDLLATYGTGGDAVTTVVVRQAQLVTVERPRSSIGEGSGAVVTVALDDPDEIIAMAHASQLAKITLVRSTGAPPLPPGDTYRAPAEGVR